MQKVDYWIWFAQKNGLRSKRRLELLEQFDSPETLFHMTKDEMKKKKLSIRERLIFQDKDLSYVESIKERCREVGIHILTYDNPAYPEKLKEIQDPPLVLYVRCKERINLNEKICISMVGNRAMTKYGELAANEIAKDLAKAGIVVVSGMAAGIDSASHVGALRGGGLTVAVLGCGVDVVYPKQNERLMHDIIMHGMVISEYPPGTPPIGKHFPVRNRIISGLSEGVVIVEAPARSGSLITADLALKQNRDVFAVPGDINRTHSRGCNKLISKGAILVNAAEDVLKEYELKFRNILKQYQKAEKSQGSKEDSFVYTETKEEAFVVSAPETALAETPDFSGMTDVRKRIAENLSLNPTSLEKLSEKTKLSADELSMELTMMELEGIIRQLPGKNFVLNA